MPSQLFVVAALVAAGTVGHAPWPVLVALALIMEAGAALGFAFAAVLRRKAATRIDELPLNRRRTH